MKKLALRETNAGLRVHRKGQPDEQIAKGNWPALVSEVDWRRVKALLTASDPRVSRPANRQHLLTWGIGVCGVCAVTCEWRTGRRRASSITSARTATSASAAGWITSTVT